MARLTWEEIEALPDGTELVCKYRGIDPVFNAVLRDIPHPEGLPILMRASSTLRLHITDPAALRPYELQDGEGMRTIKTDVESGALILKLPPAPKPRQRRTRTITGGT